MKISTSYLIPLLAFVFLASCTKSEPPPNPVAVATPLEATVSKDPSYQIPEKFELVPGQSLGDAKLGEDRASLLRKGFVPDKDYADGLYLIRDGLHVSLYGDKADLIWLERTQWGKILYKGQPLEIKTLKDAQKIFSPCEPAIQGSAGSLIYCVNRGLRIDTRLPGDELSGFSVVTATNYDQVVGGKK